MRKNESVYLVHKLSLFEYNQLLYSVDYLRHNFKALSLFTCMHFGTNTIHGIHDLYLIKLQL